MSIVSVDVVATAEAIMCANFTVKLWHFEGMTNGNYLDLHKCMHWSIFENVMLLYGHHVNKDRGIFLIIINNKIGCPFIL